MIFLPNEPEFSAAELVLNGQTYDLTQDEAPLGFRTRYGYGRGEYMNFMTLKATAILIFHLFLLVQNLYSFEPQR